MIGAWNNATTNGFRASYVFGNESDGSAVLNNPVAPGDKITASVLELSASKQRELHRHLGQAELTRQSDPHPATP